MDTKVPYKALLPPESGGELDKPHVWGLAHSFRPRKVTGSPWMLFTNIFEEYASADVGYAAPIQEIPSWITDLELDPYELRIVFRALANDWRSATQTVSSVDEMVLHPSYQRIVALGVPALPLILDELRRAPTHWFPALVAITRYDAAAGTRTVDEAVSAWLRWGEERGILDAA